MDVLTLFLHQHARTHSAAIAAMEGEFSLEESAVRGLTEEQLRIRPHGLNSIAWILWHIARAEDVAINVIVASRPQVWDADSWSERLRVARRDVGTGMTADEVAALSASIDIPALRAYRAGVGQRTREVAQSLPLSEWDRSLEAERYQAAANQGAFGPNAGGLAKFWEGKTAAFFLSWVAVGHNLSHLGQARWVKKLVQEDRK